MVLLSALDTRLPTEVSSYRMEESVFIEERRRREVVPSGKAIASLILSILALVTFFIPVLGVVGLIYGVGALREIRASRGRLSGAKVASAGVALAVVSFIIAFFFYGPVAWEIAEIHCIAEALKSYSETHDGSLPQDLQEITPLLKEEVAVSLDTEDFVYLGDSSVMYGDEKIIVCSAQPALMDFFLAIQADGKVRILRSEEVQTILAEKKDREAKKGRPVGAR